MKIELSEKFLKDLKKLKLKVYIFQKARKKFGYVMKKEISDFMYREMKLNIQYYSRIFQ